MFWTYVLKSKQRDYIYVGLTNNLDRRISEHTTGKEKTTRAYAPFRLIHFESFQTRPEARKREKFLKSGCGKEWVKQKFKHEWRNW
ncbi:GIY-YIG nuclease family protein [Candidatus Gracilibacteria bacterium]|nr:GIY-YIG nuclease family protein [Candidatus Gracilibacteria bacterium]MCF7819140.1 GIY-YIG nuclease family protein [Candidatus Gracilibacteria bacterium]